MRLVEDPTLRVETRNYASRTLRQHYGNLAKIAFRDPKGGIYILITVVGIVGQAVPDLAPRNAPQIDVHFD
jgi:hypothetical protein